MNSILFFHFLRKIWLILPLLIISNNGFSQVTIGFQGGEPGDSWGYTSTGASALALSETTTTFNKVTGTRSLVAGGTTGGGNCFAGGSGNGTSIAHTFTFDVLDITSSSAEVRTLTFSWGNRFPVCSGTGWDSGENLVFIAYHDGIAQPPVTLANGYNNAAFSINSNQYTWTVPACVTSFYFVLSVTTNRADELLFIDDVRLTTPQIIPPLIQPSPVTGAVTVCEGTVETYHVTAQAGTSYTWSGLPAGSAFTTPNGTNSITVDWGTAPAGTYTLTVTPSNNCPVNGPSRTIDVTILGVPAVTIIPTGTVTICPGDSVLLTASGDPGNYTWSDGTIGDELYVTSVGDYFVTLINACGTAVSDTVSVVISNVPVAQVSGTNFFCPGDSVLLTATGGTSYVWSDGQTTTSIYVHTPGNYTVTSSNSCGTIVSDPFFVSQGTLPAAQLAGGNTFCEGDSVLLTTTGGDSYIWSTGTTGNTIYVTSPGNYFVTASNACGQSVSTTITVTEVLLPTPVITGNSSFCPGESLVLTATGGTSYLWSTGATGNTITVNTPGNYTVTSSNQCGTVQSPVFPVIQLSNPDAAINGTFVICPGETVALTASGGDNYLWSNGETTPVITISQAGTYTVTVVNACGSDQTTVTVISSGITADFSFDQTYGVPVSVTFQNESSQDALSHYWNFGNGQTATTMHPETAYNSEGVYQVILTVTDALECTSSHSEWITVKGIPSVIEVPNVFSPNNDFINDVFLVKANNIEEFEMQILNRWGDIMIILSNIHVGWDGTINGNQASDGTYFYQIKAKGFDQQLYQLSGFFQLVR